MTLFSPRRVAGGFYAQDERGQAQGGDGADYWLADGFHRYHAANKAGWKAFSATVSKGTVRDAQWYSFGANKDHGLRRHRGDLRAIIEKILNDDEWASTSQVKIAEHVGVSAQYVSKVKLSINQLIDRPAEREVTRNGKTYTQNTSNIGKSKPEKNTEIVDTETGEVLESAAVMTTLRGTYRRTDHAESTPQPDQFKKYFLSWFTAQTAPHRRGTERKTASG